MKKNNVRVLFAAKAEKRFAQKKPRDMWQMTGDGVCHEIEDYIASHEAAGIHFDSEYQEIVYDERMVFMLHKENGCWTIVDVIVRLPVMQYLPVFVWKRLKRGVTEIAVKFIAGWRAIRAEARAIA